MNKTNKLYEAIHRELLDSYHGNVHHMAQRITKQVEIALLSPQQRLIYDSLHKAMSTGDIANAANLASKNVSSQLNTMYKNTMLLSRHTSNNKYYWTKK